MACPGVQLIIRQQLKSLKINQELKSRDAFAVSRASEKRIEAVRRLQAPFTRCLSRARACVLHTRLDERDSPALDRSGWGLSEARRYPCQNLPVHMGRGGGCN
ncbi:unnamed protein product [Lampetra fluviatilis]